MKNPNVYSITVLGNERSYSIQTNGAKNLIDQTIPEADANTNADLVIVDRLTAEKILKRDLCSYEDSLEAAEDFLNRGAKSILLTGVEEEVSDLGQDYWACKDSSFWLSHATKGAQAKTNLSLSSAIAYYLGQSRSFEDSLVTAKMVVNRAMRGEEGSLKDWPEDERDMPYLSEEPLLQSPKPFKRYKPGLYPLVDSSLWVKKLLAHGVHCIQLRVKNAKSQAFLEKEIKESVLMAKRQGATLFINDYWEEALKAGATGVHLGQEDLSSADVDALREKGMLLGISTHCPYDVARAHAINPSYIACGPIFATDSKVIEFPPSGIAELQRWRRTLDYPLVAIGGINFERLPAVLGAGVDGISIISAITKADDPDKAIRQWLREVEPFSAQTSSVGSHIK